MSLLISASLQGAHSEPIIETMNLESRPMSSAPFSACCWIRGRSRTSWMWERRRPWPGSRRDSRVWTERQRRGMTKWRDATAIPVRKTRQTAAGHFQKYKERINSLLLWLKASPHLFDLSQQFDGVCVGRRIALQLILQVIPECFVHDLLHFVLQTVLGTNRTFDLCGKKKTKPHQKMKAKPLLRITTLTCPPEPLRVWLGRPGWPGFRGPASCWWPLWPSPSTPPQRRTWAGWLWDAHTEDDGGIYFKMTIRLCRMQTS